MKTATFLALASAVAAQSTNYMRVMSVRSASPIHYLPMTAAGFKIYLGGETASYCPDVVKDQGGCAAGNYTTFVSGVAGDNGASLFMGTQVPGGQEVFIDSCTGEVSYTQAHSGYRPEDSIIDGWNITQNAIPAARLGRLEWEGGLIACPVNSTNGPYQVFAQVDGVSFTADCLGFDPLFSNSSEPSAWQYT